MKGEEEDIDSAKYSNTIINLLCLDNQIYDSF